jgi:hypothetical protein
VAQPCGWVRVSDAQGKVAQPRWGARVSGVSGKGDGKWTGQHANVCTTHRVDQVSQKKVVL